MIARDYYLVLARAISALDPNTADARRAVYDRARLTVMDAGLPAAETDAERAALERAIGRIEAEAKHAPLPSPASDRPARRSAAAPAGVPAPAKDGGLWQPSMPALVRAIAVALGVAALVVVAVTLLPWGGAPDRGGA